MKITYMLELLKPTTSKAKIIENNILEVQKNRISISNKLKDQASDLSSKDFFESLPSAVINQNIREVKALYKLFKKSNSKKDNLEFKKNQPLCYNNQNYKIKDHFISFPLYTTKSSRYWFPLIKNKIFHKLNKDLNKGAKLGKASLFRKKNKYYFAISLDLEIDKSTGNNIMGVDIGLNQLAVSSVKNAHGKELNRSFYNGKKAGFIRRKYRSLRRSLGQAKKPNKIRKIDDKESRYIRNLNHKISRNLINLAVQENVSTIVMEDLKNIRKTAFSLKQADRSLNSWSFYQLQQFIEYKAKLKGLDVIYISPKYTSQTCSNCRLVSKFNRKGNAYTCTCGNNIHSDLNAARNICDLGTNIISKKSA